jgi:glycerol-3-phosphate dehydrogenase
MTILHLNRERNLEALKSRLFDVLVVGGGINGAVSAASLAAKGARVALVDKGDFASFTSQESSSLVWGGIKYMENFEFGLVANLCKSRNELLSRYPDSVKEIRFFCPHEKANRHSLLKLFAGTWLYWTLGRGGTRKPKKMSVARVKSEEPVVRVDTIDGGFEYSDAILADADARFVFGFVKWAQKHGAVLANYMSAHSFVRDADGHWLIGLKDQVTGNELPLRAKVLVNATGPYLDAVNDANHLKTRTRHIFSKGIHILVKRITEQKRVLTFMADDGRMFFVLPMGDVSCIGTTDTRVDKIPAVVTPEDRHYVLQQINKRLNLPVSLTEADIIAERCGVRPLAIEPRDSGKDGKDFLALSRKHVIEFKKEEKFICIFGGKLTDCVNVGEEVADFVEHTGVDLPRPGTEWFGEPPASQRREFFIQAEKLKLEALAPADCPEAITPRLWRYYGEGAFAILEAVKHDRAGQGAYLHVGMGLIRAEVAYARDHDMIVTLDDFLRRRTLTALIRTRESLKNNPDVRTVCQILFGEAAEEKWQAYFG